MTGSKDYFISSNQVVQKIQTIPYLIQTELFGYSELQIQTYSKIELAGIAELETLQLKLSQLTFTFFTLQVSMALTEMKNYIMENQETDPLIQGYLLKGTVNLLGAA